MLSYNYQITINEKDHRLSTNNQDSNTESDHLYIYLALVGYEEAFDNVEMLEMENAINNYKIDSRDRMLIQDFLLIQDNTIYFLIIQDNLQEWHNGDTITINYKIYTI